VVQVVRPRLHHFLAFRNKGGPIIGLLDCIFLDVRELRLQYVGGDAQALACHGAKRAAEAVRRKFSLESHLAQGVAQCLAVQMRGFLPIQCREHELPSRGIGKHAAQGFHDLSGEWHDVRLLHLHLGTWDNPLAGIQINLRPFHAGDRARPLRCKHGGGERCTRDVDRVGRHGAHQSADLGHVDGGGDVPFVRLGQRTAQGQHATILA
jgi:hypothetical protein